MKADRLIRTVGWASAALTIVGAATRILHVLPAWTSLLHLGILLFLINEVIRYQFATPVKSWQHHVRFAAHVMSFLLVFLTLVAGQNLFPFALLLLTLAFVLPVLSPTRTSAT